MPQVVCKDIVRAFLTPEELSHTLSDLEAKHAELTAILCRVVDDLISELRANSQLDVQGMIDTFLLNEQEQAEERRKFRAGIAGLRKLRSSRTKRPLWSRKVISRALDLFDGASEIYRDARWRLICARAHFAPSDGTGEIHGDGGLD
jgi:hypothetical protein